MPLSSFTSSRGIRHCAGLSLAGKRPWGGRNKAKLRRCLGQTVLALGLLLAGCAKQASDTTEDTTEDQGILKEQTRGPVTIRLRLDHREITIAQRLNLSLEVDADETYEIKLPKVGDKLQQFGIANYSTSPPELIDNDKVRTIRSYILEPFLSGKYTIPSMQVTFKKKGDPADPWHKIQTEEVTVTVKSLLPQEAAELDIEDICGPLNLPEPVLTLSWWLFAIILLVVVGIFLVFRAIKKRRPGQDAPVRSIPAHEIAYAELQQLVADDLIKKKCLKQFYQRISNILRHYIENRFALHAPERTTEEFLRELGTTDLLNQDWRQLLETFLVHCDLVKFAEHKPSTKGIQQTFDSCKTFITETKNS